MSEESQVDKGKSLEAACDNLIDIENITTNGGLDILKKASHENTEKLSSSTEHIAEHFATKGNNICLYVSACKLQQYPAKGKSFCKFYEPEMFTLAMKFYLSL